MSSTQTPGYRTLSPDTAEWADRMLFEHWARMPPTEKADLVSELCLSAHRLTLLGLSRLYPDASPRELELREACRRLGRDVVEQVLGHALPFPEST